MRLLGLDARDTFGSVIARHRGIGPGFDLLRIALATLIFTGHAKWIAGGQSYGAVVALPGVAHAIPAAGASAAVAPIAVSLTQPLKLALVPAFFALSGFLVAGSALRLRRTSTFLAHRFLRIFPALVVEVTLSAMVLGPLVTRLPAAAYWSDPGTWRYLLNVVGQLSFVLPGVFERNPLSEAVNVSLWTLPSELRCYIITAAIMILGVMYNRRLLTIGIGALWLGLAVAHFLYGISNRHPYADHLIVCYFLLGLLFYQWRDHIPVAPILFVPLAAAAYVTMFFDQLVYVTLPLLTWCTIAIGMAAFPRIRLLATGDYSYGIYLYGFPICQTLLAFVPWFVHRDLVFTVVAAILTCGFAVASWHLIEKRVLSLKHRLPETWFPTTARGRAARAAHPVGNGAAGS